MAADPAHGDPAAAVDAPPRRARRWPALALLAVALALHLALLLYFAPPRVMFAADPVATIDYSLHAYQVDRARKAYGGWGQLWSYDPQQLAGQPAGAIEDMSSKSLIFFVIALSKLGVHPSRAFNLYILLVHLLVPLLAFLAARLFGLTPLQSALTALLWVLLWFFDSFIHWAWFCGMISWSFVSCLAILLVALVHHVLERRSRWLWIAVAGLAALVALVHPYGVLIAALPCAALCLRDLRRLGARGWAGLTLTVATMLAVASIWFLPARRFWHYVMDSANFLQPGPLYLLTDLLDLLKEPWETGGGPVRTALRFLCLAAAGIALWRWYRGRDRRALPLATLVGPLLLLSYFGGLLWVTRQVQPYRHIMPAALAAALPAAALLVELFSRERLRELGRPARTLLVLAAVLVVPRLALTVLYYMPDGLPVARKPIPGANPTDPPPEPTTGLYGPRPGRMAHHGTDLGAVQIKAWLEAHARGRGRVLVQDWILGEYLAWASDVPIIGGIEERNVHHVDAHLFRWHPDGNVPGAALRAYFERYAIGFVVVHFYKPALEWRKDALKFRALIGGNRIYETRIEPSYFLRGQGEITSQSLNSIKVRGAAGEELVLRFHWMETLRCRPGCTVERYAVAGDRVGFIRVPRPPPELEIYNSYQFAPRVSGR
jgi:hypothetical protein